MGALVAAGPAGNPNLSIRETARRMSVTTNVSMAGCAIRTWVTLSSDTTYSGAMNPNTARNASYRQFVDYDDALAAVLDGR